MIDSGAGALQVVMPGCPVQAFAAVQASVVHLQGVPLSKRFALVPLGPPILSYSSTSKVPAFEDLCLGNCLVFSSFSWMLGTICV